MGEGMAKENGQQSNERKRGKDGQYLPDEDEKKIAPRKRVHNAQVNVLAQVDKILRGNCAQAKKGNFNCAKFVLDWSMVSDLRTPLAKPLKSKTLAGALLKQLGKKARSPSKPQEPSVTK
jgi:hypothetical protein